MRVLLGETNFVLNYSTGAVRYGGNMIAETGANTWADASVFIPVTAGLTPAQFRTNLIAAINAELNRLTLPNATEIFGTGIEKFL